MRYLNKKIILIGFLFVPIFSGAQGNFSKIWINNFIKPVDFDTLKGNDLQVTFTQPGFSFIIGEKGSNSRVWGGGVKPKGIYPDEKLTSLFARRIDFKTIDLQDGTLSWIFTGPKAGVTIEIGKSSILIKQRFYDSYGMLDTLKNIPKLIEHDFIQSEINYKGTIQNITVSVDHQLKLKIFVNDKLIATQLCIVDLDRHQLKYSGIKGNVEGFIRTPSIDNAEIKVHPDKMCQQILGFGGIASIGAFRDLSPEGKDRWWKYIREYNLLIQREYPNGTQLREDCSNWDNFNDATIHYYGDNFPNGEISDFAYNKTIQDMGGMVIFEFWDLPPWMIKTYIYNNKQYEGADTGKYAMTYVNYCRTAEKKTGHPPAIVGIQNEKNQSPEMWQQMTLTLRKVLDENGFKEVKIHMHNSGTLTGGIAALRAFTVRDEVWNKINFAASNLYDYQQFFTNPDGFDSTITKWKIIAKDKPFLSTEICINSPAYQHDSYRLAFQEGQLYHKNLVLLDARAIIYCWSILNGPHPSFDATRSLFRVNYQHNSTPEPSSHQLRVLGSYSRNIKQNMYRVELESTDKNLLASCFENSGKKTLVLMNRGITVINVLQNEYTRSFTTVEVCDQFSENRVADFRTVVTDHGILVQPGQIITLFTK